jgi:hypothetical protein
MADSADPVSVLKAGAAILTPVLAPAGFTFHLTSHVLSAYLSGRGSVINGNALL